jgi:hypothetical protein
MAEDEAKPIASVTHEYLRAEPFPLLALQS